MRQIQELMEQVSICWVWNEERQTRVVTDASGVGIGAMLEQWNTGTRHVGHGSSLEQDSDTLSSGATALRIRSGSRWSTVSRGSGNTSCWAANLKS